MGTETNARVLAKEVFEDKFDGALEIAHRDVAVHIQTFDLVEGGIVGGVGIVAPIHTARHNDTNRRILLCHRADLDRRGVSAKQKGRLGGFLAQVKSVLRIARGVVRRGVQGIEAMIFIFDFGTIGHGKADFAEAADDIVGDLGEGVKLAQGMTSAGQGEIGGFFWQCGFEFQFATALGQGGFQFDFDLVDEFAGSGALFLREGAELFHQRSKFAIGPQESALGLIEGSQIGSRSQFAERGLFKRFDFV